MRKQRRVGKRPFYKYWAGLTRDQKQALAKEMDTEVEYLYQIAADFREGSTDFIKKLEKKTGIPKEKMLPDVYA